MLGKLFQKKPPAFEGPDLSDLRPGRGEFEGVAPYYDHLMRAVPYSQWVDYIQSLLRHHDARPKRVLDLCCGTGRAGEEFVRRGYDTVGADLSEPMVRECAGRSPALPAIVSDASWLAIRDESFDLTISVYDSLNYILDPGSLARCFREVFRTLRPGALFIFDVNTPRALSSGLFTQDNMDSQDPLLYRWKANWDAASRICRVDMWFQWRGQSGAPVEFRETHCQFAYNNAEIIEMLEAAGFARVHAYQAYTFRPLTRWSDRAYYVARKES
ncbi:MAG: class I SAM-dependent methyltransferase [Armatimonadetes bacterium]|nr:class I SAM-dependent methyltransferase [Armatimonadota bacterium]